MVDASESNLTNIRIHHRPSPRAARHNASTHNPHDAAVTHCHSEMTVLHNDAHNFSTQKKNSRLGFFWSLKYHESGASPVTSNTQRNIHRK